jgi:nucleoside-diphosphate-sugar epimerase
VSELLQRGVAHVRILGNLSAYLFDQLSVFCEDFLNDDRVELVKEDVADRETVRKAMQDIDFVFHLAAYADVAATIYNSDEDFRRMLWGRTRS